MTGLFKHLPYKDSSGLHWPDTTKNSETYFAIDLSDLVNIESEYINEVTWTLPSGLSYEDSYLNSARTEASLKITACKAGNFRVKGNIKSTDAGKVSNKSIEILLTVY